MIDLKRWNWIWLLPCAVFQLMPNAAAAQNSYQPVSKAERQCVVSTTKDALRNDPQVRQQLDQTLSQVRAQSCQSGEQAAQEQFVMMMSSVLAGITQQHVLMKCFPTLLQQQDAQAHEKLNTITQIIVQTLMQTVPRPLCP